MPSVFERAADIMRAATSEFALAALAVLASVPLAIVSGWLTVTAVVSALIFGWLGHRKGTRQLDADHELQLADHELQLTEQSARLELERLDAEKRRELTSFEVAELAAEVADSGRIIANHWPQGVDASPSLPPAGIDPLEFLIFRHSRSADAVPQVPSVPRVRHYIDLRVAALAPTDLALMVEVLVKYIRKHFDVDNYTGILVPRSGNVILGLAVAEELGMPVVLGRERPLFGRATESLLPAGLLLMVDDIWSDATILLRTKELAGFDNFAVADCVLLVERLTEDGDMAAQFANKRMSFRSVRAFTDAGLDELFDRAASALEQAGEPTDLDSG